MNSSENGVFCACGVNGMHAMGLQCIFPGSTTRCNAMPFSAAAPHTALQEMHTALQEFHTALQEFHTALQEIRAGASHNMAQWGRGSSKVPRPVREQTFLQSFQNSQQPHPSRTVSLIRHRRIALNRTLPNFSREK